MGILPLNVPHAFCAPENHALDRPARARLPGTDGGRPTTDENQGGGARHGAPVAPPGRCRLGPLSGGLWWSPGTSQLLAVPAPSVASISRWSAARAGAPTVWCPWGWEGAAWVGQVSSLNPRLRSFCTDAHHTVRKERTDTQGTCPVGRPLENEGTGEDEGVPTAHVRCWDHLAMEPYDPAVTRPASRESAVSRCCAATASASAATAGVSGASAPRAGVAAAPGWALLGLDGLGTERDGSTRAHVRGRSRAQHPGVRKTCGQCVPIFETQLAFLPTFGVRGDQKNFVFPGAKRRNNELCPRVGHFLTKLPGTPKNGGLQGTTKKVSRPRRCAVGTRYKQRFLQRPLGAQYLRGVGCGTSVSPPFPVSQRIYTPPTRRVHNTMEPDCPPWRLVGGGMGVRPPTGATSPLPHRDATLPQSTMAPFSGGRGVSPSPGNRFPVRPPTAHVRGRATPPHQGVRFHVARRGPFSGQKR